MERDPWILIAGGFHDRGGMDKANLRLAEHLVEEGHDIHLVSFDVAPDLAAHPRVTVYLVRRPLRSFMLGGIALNRMGQKVVRRIKVTRPAARVLTNGGSCRWNDICWAHYIHRAWPRQDTNSPFWFKVKDRLAKQLAVLAERRTFLSAEHVIANSGKTRSDLIAHIGVSPSKIHVLYLGGEAAWSPATEAERHAAKADLRIEDTAPVVIFVGALGLDNRKGFDTLWTAWKQLCSEPAWDAHLLVAGSGNGLPGWRRRANLAGLANRVTFLGLTGNIPHILAAADLLVSPVRYEAYGLNVQEAICRGIPAMVSGSSGIAERYPADLNAFLLSDPEDPRALSDRLQMWRKDIDLWKRRFEPFSRLLRSRTWREMAQDLVSIVTAPVESVPAAATETARSL